MYQTSPIPENIYGRFDRMDIYQASQPIELQCAKSKGHRSILNEYSGVDDPGHPHALAQFLRDSLINPIEYLILPWRFFTKIISEEPLSTMRIIKLLRHKC